MRLYRLAQQPDGSRYRGKRDRQSVAAKFVAHSLGGVVDRFADPIFRAADERRRRKGVAFDAELAPELAALEHRTARGDDQAGTRRTHHSSSATSCRRSRRSAVRTSRPWCDARRPVKAARATRPPKKRKST